MLMQRIVMTYKVGKLLIFFCAIFIGGPLAFALSPENKEMQLTEISGHIQKIQQTLSHDQQREIDLQQQLKISELQIADLSQQMQILNIQLNAKAAELEKVKKMQEVALQELTKQQQILTRQIRIIYQLKQSQAMKAIFDPANLNMANRHLTYYHKLNSARAALMSKIKLIIDSLNKNIALMATEEQNLQNLLMQKQQQQRAAQTALVRRERIITAINEKTYSRQQQLAILLNNQKSLQSMITTLPTAEIAPLPTATFKQVQGQLTWPINGIKITPLGTLIQNEQHLTGVVIKAPEGAPVRSIYAGRIIFAGWLRGYGLLVIINHGDGYMSLYGRNHAIYGKVGDIVHPGDIVATIGNSGGFNQPSLYFEIRRNGIPLDPRNWFA
jgi:murein hydrolase activator